MNIGTLSHLKVLPLLKSINCSKLSYQTPQSNVKKTYSFSFKKKPQRLFQTLKANLMAHNNALILDLSESSNNVEMWAKILRVWETITTHNLKERHLIVTDPNVSYNLCSVFFFPVGYCARNFIL